MPVKKDLSPNDKTQLTEAFEFAKFQKKVLRPSRQIWFFRLLIKTKVNAFD